MSGMSGTSIGTIAGAVVGAIAGYFTGNPLLGASIGATLGGAIGTALDPPKNNNNALTGSRLSDLTIQTSTYGAFITRLYGTCALWGNIFWLENNELKEVAKKQKSGGKGMGGMMGGGTSPSTYTYFATFALGLCEGPITDVTRIWIGPKLFYTKMGDIDALIASGENKQYFKIYYGSDDQLPDPRMQANLGIANVPGYRGLAYIIFYDLPLADYGNSLIAAQIKVEVVKLGAPVVELLKTLTMELIDHGYPHEFFSISGTLPIYLAEYSQALTGYTFPVEICDFSLENPLRKIILIAANDGASSSYIQSLHKVHDTIYHTTLDVNINEFRLFVNGLYKADLRPPLNYPNLLGNGEKQQVNLANGNAQYYTDDHLYVSVATRVGTASFTIFNAIFRWPLNSSGVTVADRTASNVDENPSANLMFWMNMPGDGFVYALTAAKTLKKYDLDLNLLSAVTLAFLPPLSLTLTYQNFRGFAVDGDYIYAASDQAINRYNLLSGALSGSYAFDTFITPYPYRLMPMGDLLYVQYLRTVLLLNFNALAISSIPLSEIVKAETLQSNLLTISDIDATSLTPLVRGYRLGAIGSIRTGLDPLSGAWPFDAIQHGYVVKYILRGTPTVAGIIAADLDAREASAEPGIQIMNSREMDSILPKKVTIRYFDVEREYDTGEQYFERINTDAVNELMLEWAIVLNANEAIQKAEILLYMYWMERYDLAFTLPPKYASLEPADCIVVYAENAQYELRLTSISTTTDNRLECRAKYNSADVYLSNSVGESGQSIGQTLTLSGPAYYELLDIPMLQDTYNLAGFPVAMTGNLPGWPGGTLFKSADGGATWNDIQGIAAPGAIMGITNSILSAHLGTTLDKAGILQAAMVHGTLSSTTEEGMFAGANWFAYGIDSRWEIIAAQNCVIQSDKNYILTDFMRGQFGTEWATGLHQIGDKLIYLSSVELAFVLQNNADIGIENAWRGITNGKTIDSDSSRLFTYTGVNLECLSPCHAAGNRDPGSRDWTLTWMRRSRFAGWRDLVDAQLGEATEAYEVDIFSDGSYTVIKRVLAINSQTATYTAAQQLTDFGDYVSTVYARIYQLSIIVGRGYALNVELTGDIPNISVLLLHFNGANGSTTFIDSSPTPKTPSAVNGNSQISTAQSKFGGSSLLLDGAGDDIRYADHADFKFGSGDFTIECWIRPASTGTNKMFLAKATASGYGPFLLMTNSGLVKYYATSASGSWNIANGITIGTIAANTWYHVAVTRSGTTFRTFLNGVAGATATSSAALLDNTADLSVGSYGAGAALFFDGNIEDIRLTKGFALYTNNFTPPIAELT